MQPNFVKSPEFVKTVKISWNQLKSAEFHWINIHLCENHHFWDIFVVNCRRQLLTEFQPIPPIVGYNKTWKILLFNILLCCQEIEENHLEIHLKIPCLLVRIYKWISSTILSNKECHLILSLLAGRKYFILHYKIWNSSFQLGL